MSELSQTCQICQTTVCVHKREYRKIIHAWLNNEPSRSIYVMMVDWAKRCLLTGGVDDDLNDLVKHSEYTDEIVQEFICGKKYEQLRKKYE